MWLEGAGLWAGLALAAYGAISGLLQAFSFADYLSDRTRLCTYVVLVHNQQDRIEWVVRTLAQEDGVDLILVDLGSTDDSPAILERLASAYGQTTLMQLVDGLDEAEAVEIALRHATSPVVALFDLRSDRSFGK